MRAVSLSSIVVLLSLVAIGTTSSVRASEGFDDLVKLIKSGVKEEVILAYVDASPTAYDFSVDEILFLNDLGVAPKIVTEAVSHGKLLRTLAAKDPGNAAPPAPVAQAPAPQDQPPPVQPVQVQDPVVGAPPPSVTPVGPPPPQDIQPAVQTVDAGPAPAVAPPPEDANISTFYDTLSPYGSWVEVDGNWVWRPTVAVSDPGWRPYCDRGNWLYTDSGWAWHSEYSWGWAPFHYGRWSRHGTYGWVWAPDTVWSPAWVSWRSSDSHYGWAPLPPAARFDVGVGFNVGGAHVDLSFGLGERDYYFVPAERIYEPTLATFVLPGAEVSVVFGRTAIIENNVTVINNRVVVRGPDIERVRIVTHRNIEVVHITDEAIRPGDHIRGNSLHGNEFAVYRPAIKNEIRETPPAVIARQQAAQLRRETTQDIRAQRIDNRAQRTADRRENDFAARQNVLDNKTEAHDARVNQNAAEAAARIRARQDEAAARSDTRVTRRDAVDTQRVENNAEAQARIQNRSAASSAEAMAREQTKETRRDTIEQRRVDNTAETQARLQARQAAEAQRSANIESRVETRRETTAAEAQARQQAEAQRAAEAAARSAQTREVRREPSVPGPAVPETPQVRTREIRAADPTTDTPRVRRETPAREADTPPTRQTRTREASSQDDPPKRGKKAPIDGTSSQGN